jgi:hypothetical protein
LEFADDESDAAAIKRYSGVEAHKVDNFFVTGTQHELDKLGRNVDEHFRWLLEKVKNSKLEQSFAQELAGTLSPFRYQDRLIWKLEPEKRSSPVTYDGKFFDRIGPRTEEVADATALVELIRRFP